MFVITGITGQVGSTLARNLLAQEHEVRAVVRDAVKGSIWREQGCEVVVADMYDKQSLSRAFTGAEAVFILLPPNFDPSPDFSESCAIIANIFAALQESNPKKVVCLSTIGAQATQRNLLSQLSEMERRLSHVSMPIAFLRAAWFMENSVWDIIPARDQKVLHSLLQPLDKAFPMVATADVGRTAAQMMLEQWDGVRLVELEGPHRVTPLQIADSLGRLLGVKVQAQSVPRNTWESMFRDQGMNNPLPRIQMLDGFNEGWIEFAGSPQRGTVELDTVLRGLVERLG
ncbi:MULTISPECIES: NmrA family NAD(P)-binding protein [unclassified Pseudomonas]|uniref:NmrA family NAD(P)-binding protein n=1 Tax=unclassified Pseudomonas TaxID=196821 RepID=UPI000871206A|nr:MULTISPECIES: NmrA family NAD(P)-binding protein [unclassified Pseudomonas]SCW26900.1 Uncharacterized conserved protein YbjT, contains NAD(P)-binding and DUF2867 domains [Pseudomonas sp. NFACC56-3]SFK08587.1 Uncharacterized conserved protein YbjT, contains NAD(P)-binding and DUF2867 domains [Pseudomonas sp. NFACC52]